jgi:hypothetical protein
MADAGLWTRENRECVAEAMRDALRFRQPGRRTDDAEIGFIGLQRGKDSAAFIVGDAVTHLGQPPQIGVKESGQIRQPHGSRDIHPNLYLAPRNSPGCAKHLIDASEHAIRFRQQHLAGRREVDAAGRAFE